MKKLFFLLALALVLCACGTTFQSAEEKAAYQAKIVQQIADKLDNRRFTIDVNYMRPRGSMQPRSVDGYSLALKGDTVISYLPYFGRVSSGIYGYGGDSGLNFTGKVENYTVTYPKSGLMRVTFVTRSREDRYHYQVEVTTGGSAAITVIGDDHQSIDFEGNLHIDY